MTTHNTPIKLDLEIRRDIHTSNPRKFIRFLRNTCRGMGYRVATDTIDVMKDEVGEVGVVRGNLAVKDSHSEVLSFKKYEVPEYTAPALAVAGLLLAVIGFVIGFFIVALGVFLLAPAAYLYFFNEVRERIEWANQIEVQVEGEVYEGAQQTAQASGSETRETRVTSEITVILTGSTPYPKTQGDQLKSDIRTLSDQFEEFVEV